MSDMPRCDRCGRFHNAMAPGASYAMRYSGWPLSPDHEDTRCVSCTAAHGPLTAQLGVAEWTAGTIKLSPQQSNEAAGSVEHVHEENNDG